MEEILSNIYADASLIESYNNNNKIKIKAAA